MEVSIALDYFENCLLAEIANPQHWENEEKAKASFKRFSDDIFQMLAPAVTLRSKEGEPLKEEAVKKTF